MKVYLCGPINGCADDQAVTWREQVKARIGAGSCIDPMRRDFRGIEDQSTEEIVAGDLADIDAADAILANCWTPSYGSAMELWYAASSPRHLPVVVVVPDVDTVSPWLRYVASAVVGTVDEAVDLIGRLT